MKEAVRPKVIQLSDRFGEIIFPLVEPIELQIHVYECGVCEFKFGVGMEHEEQDRIGCPDCKDDKFVKHLGSGTMTITHPPTA